MTIELILLSRVSFREHEVTGPRLRGLIALLAGDLRAGCSTARLVEGLWPDDQPENPTKALQVLVSRARAQLGSEVITSTPTGYRLSLSEDQVDASAVLLSASVSAQHARTGDHAAALAHAETGLALWEGAACNDNGLDDPLSALRAERVSAYRSLVRARSLALSRLGRREEAVEALTDLFRERPRDEEVLLELLRCEAATVGPSAALARYDEYRRSLRDELGADPGPALQTMYQQLLQGELPSVRHGIPHEPNPLLGRADDIEAVAKLLRTSRVTSIVGPGGLGKTRLANVVSRQAEQRVVHLVGLTGVTSDDDVAGEVASVLGVGETRRAPVSRLTGIVNALGAGPVLLVLDNCEHVIRGAAELVRALVSMSKDLRVLTTSRTPLGLSSEAVYLLPELTLPTMVELFERRARAARPGADLPADVVAELCSHLDGLPLAVELAAARIRVMSVSEIARRLEDRFTLLRGGARDAPQRHQTLHAVVDWSWNLLEPAGQAALRALSIFPGGFAVDAARYLLGDSDVLEALENLVDQSLLKVLDTQSGTRFRMLETVREFSTAHRDAAGETERVTGDFLAWAREFGKAHYEAIFGVDPFEADERIRAEQDNLLQAHRHGLARLDSATVVATSAVLGALWMVDSNYTRVGTLVDETAWILSHFRPESDFVEVTRAAAAMCAAYTFLIQGPRAARSLVALRRLPPAPPNTLIRGIAKLLCAAPEYLGADRSVLDAMCDSDQPYLAGLANVTASYLWEGEGEVELALAAATRALETFDDQATPWMRIMGHSRVGELHLQVGSGEQARRHFLAALRVLGDRLDVIGIRWGMVVANLGLGAIDEAAYWWDLASLYEADEPVATYTFGLGMRAEILLARGEVDAGLSMWRRAVDQLPVAENPIFGIAPGLDPWSLEIQAAAVVAHAHHGRLDAVEELAGGLPAKLAAMLANPLVKPPPSIMEFPVCGLLLVAAAVVELDRAKRTGDDQAVRTGVRLIALAERFRFGRQFQPTMSADRIRELAEQADRSAYADAVSSYAALGRVELRAAALAVLAGVSGRGPSGR